MATALTLSPSHKSTFVKDQHDQRQTQVYYSAESLPRPVLSMHWRQAARTSNSSSPAMCVATGEKFASDAALNDQALVDGSRLLSAYTTLKSVKIWIITEAADDSGHRLATTALLPSEY